MTSALLGDGMTKLKKIPIPVWPVMPTPYTGEIIGTDAGKVGEGAVVPKGQLKLLGGFGIPSAGMLKIADGSKAFGVLGQAKNREVTDITGKKSEIPWDAAKRGQIFPEEDLSNACQKGYRNYVALTIIPKVDFLFPQSLRIKFKNVRFNDGPKKVHLLPPETTQA